MAKILVVEDDEALGANLDAWLTAEHHNVEVSTTGEQALELLSAFPYGLVILDWELPGYSGIAVVRSYRSSGGRTVVNHSTLVLAKIISTRRLLGSSPALMTI